ncbi:serine/threonine protein kinase [Aquibacillus halophilus]|uniref:Serine/threonine protein kinase n=1 Tax=Aquibacillus halophilus TaxID=930132 RepID=A0A6A8D5R1_9BACI|nr:serine/threonine protein kinase [Aquibacillus halophilus]MRH41095.1 serine/threonine protein kinase [Aquibacillus halophilus]
MEKRWEMAMQSLSEISISSSSNNEPVTIYGGSENLRCVGVGTDAAVFQFLHTPEYAFKRYADNKFSKIEIEESVYEKIGDSRYFSKCFASYDNYLVLSYEDGITLYDCLLQGIHIPEQVIKDVEDARDYVREKGLNPRDIHLKNILLQNGRAKIIDVSEYVQQGNDFRWEHLKKAYEDYYHLIDSKSVPYWLLETIRKWYNHWNKYASTFDEFMHYVLGNTTFKK